MNKKITKKKVVYIILIVCIIAVVLFIKFSGLLVTSVSPSASGDSLTTEQRIAEYEPFGITIDENSSAYLYNEVLIGDLVDGDFHYTNSAGTVYLIINRDSEGLIKSVTEK